MLPTEKFSNDPLSHKRATKSERGNEDTLSEPPDRVSPENERRVPDVLTTGHATHITAIERLIKIRSGFSNSMLQEMISENSDFSVKVQSPGKVSGGRALLYPELPWGAPPGWETGHSRGQNFLIVWDCIIFLCCLYVAGAVPFELGILDSIQRWGLRSEVPVIAFYLLTS
jgi:hypothetical protein